MTRLGLLILLIYFTLEVQAKTPGRPTNVIHYDLTVKADPKDSTLKVTSKIRFQFGEGDGPIYFDLDSTLKPLFVDFHRDDSAQLLVKEFSLVRQGNRIKIWFDNPPAPGTKANFDFSYHSRPKIAINPPWQGGLVWSKSANGKPWVGVACQEDGASVWWPCKDDIADEPDSGGTIHCYAPQGTKAISNGHLDGIRKDSSGGAWWDWRVTYPINPYNITFNIGDYAEKHYTIPSPAGDFPATMWLLKQDSAEGYPFLEPRLQSMMAGYQALFGPYPFNRDGYQLVETNYWGMEHQSAIAYGNHFKPDAFGYDFILIHESGHEWWGNLVSIADPADMWVHEAFCTYGEALLVEREQGWQAMQVYLSLQRAKIKNLSAIQGPRDVHYGAWLDTDVYYRGAGLIHSIRLMTGDSARFIHCLQDILKTNAFKPASSESVLKVISNDLGFEKAAYLRYALSLSHIPEVELFKDSKKGWLARLPKYLGPPVTLNGSTVDGTWKPIKTKPTFPEEWLVKTKVVPKRAD